MVKILIVEDELIIAEATRETLIKMGYNVLETAMDYDEAIEILKEETPDLILLDINLGGKKDGIHLAEEINSTYGIPFIFSTSYVDQETMERAKLANPTNYLVKPFKKEQLLMAIDIALKKAAEQKEKSQEKLETEGLIIKDAIFIKEKYRYTKLPIMDILWLKSEGNYVEIYLADKKELIRQSLSGLLEKLNRPNFFRTHKSYAVNLDYITKFEPTSVTIVDTEIPISKIYSEELLKRLEVL